MLAFPRWKSWTVVMTVLAGILLALPSLLPRHFSAERPGFLQSNHVNLELDLAGRSQLLLEAKTGDVAKQRLDTMEETLNREFRRAGSPIDISDMSTAGGQLSFLDRDPAKVDAAVEIARAQSQPVGLSGQRDWSSRANITSNVGLSNERYG